MHLFASVQESAGLYQCSMLKGRHCERPIWTYHVTMSPCRQGCCRIQQQQGQEGAIV